MEENVPIKVYMTKKLIGVTPDTTVQEASRIMVEFDIGSLVVIENDKVIGFFTQTDIIRRVIVPGKPYTATAKEIMLNPTPSLQNESLFGLTR